MARQNPLHQLQLFLRLLLVVWHLIHPKLLLQAGSSSSSSLSPPPRHIPQRQANLVSYGEWKHSTQILVNTIKYMYYDILMHHSNRISLWRRWHIWWRWWFKTFGASRFYCRCKNKSIWIIRWCWFWWWYSFTIFSGWYTSNKYNDTKRKEKETWMHWRCQGNSEYFIGSSSFGIRHRWWRWWTHYPHQQPRSEWWATLPP